MQMNVIKILGLIIFMTLEVKILICQVQFLFLYDVKLHRLFLKMYNICIGFIIECKMQWLVKLKTLLDKIFLQKKILILTRKSLFFTIGPKE